MSYTMAYLIKPGGKIVALEEFRNSHGFGPFVWDAVCDKYLPGERSWLSNHEKLWPLRKDTRLPRSWRASLLASYDMAIIERDRFEDIATLIRAFVLDVGLRGRACHWPAIADLLDKHSGSRVQGMCFYGTSLSEDLWHPWDSEKDRGTTYSPKKGNKHFFVGAELDRSEKEAAQPPATPPAADQPSEQE